MSKNRPSARAKGHQQQLETLLAAMGFAEADPFSRYALVKKLERIERSYRVAVSGKRPHRKLVRSYRGAITKALSLSKKIGPDFLVNEIEKAGWSRYNPGVDDLTLQGLMSDHKQRDMAAVLTEHQSDIDHWLKTSADDYRKRVLRKIVVEPVLQLMIEFEIHTSRKRLPLSQISRAVFDWLGVERKFRLSNTAINAIARDLAGTRSSDPNATQRTKN
jgi:hypothetical protein